MNRIPLFFLICFMSLTMFAQSSFEWKDGISNTVEEFDATNQFYNASVYLINTTSSELTLGWTTIEDTAPEAWYLSLCDYTSCYIGVPESGQMTTIEAGQEGFIKINISGNDVLTTASFKFYVFDIEDPENGAICSFELTSVGGVTGVNDIPLAQSVDLYPNPSVDGFVSIENQFNEPIQILIIEITGKLVEEIALQSSEKALIDTRSWNSGIYIVNSLSKSNSYSQQLVIR